MGARLDPDRPLDVPAVHGHAARYAGRAFEVEHAGRRGREIAAHVHRCLRAGRNLVGCRPALARRRQVEEPRRKLRVAVIRARHDRRTRRIERSPVGAEIPRMRYASGVWCERMRRDELHAPPVLHEQQARGEAPREQREDAGARATSREKPRMKPAQRRDEAADDYRFGNPVQRSAVERAADAIGPQERNCGGDAPQQRHERRQPPSTEAWQCRASLMAGRR